jgi:anaerobic selenocysteine-containing dehydrogenase
MAYVGIGLRRFGLFFAPTDMRADGGEVKVAASVCPHDCPSVCALDVDVRDDGRIGRVRGAAQPYTDGIVCAKVARYAERVHHPDRLMTPLKRVGPKGEGAFEPISWDQALDEVAAAFQKAAERHGAETVWPYFYAGTMGQVHRDGIERFRHVMGYSGQHKTFCTTLASTGWFAATGGKVGTPPEEMAEADLIIIWGGNPVHTQVHVMNWIAKARKNRGAKVVVIDPYRTETAKKADLHLALRPGTDGALACAVMNVLFAEDMANWDWMERFTDDPHGLRDHLQSRTPAWAAEITGLSEDEIYAFARLYGQTPRSFMRVGYGFTRSRNGSVNMHAVACLPSVTGAWAQVGGGALWATSGVFGLDKTFIEATDRRDPSVRMLDMSRIGPVLCGDRQDLGDGPPVTAMLIQNSNPAVTAPRSALVRQGFMREDLFLCVHEQFMTETARYADIVLPATMFLEHDDLYLASAHTYIQAHRAVLPPAGECRSNHDVLCALARRLGAEHPAFEMTALEVMDVSLKASGYEGAEALLEKRWEDKAMPPPEARFANGFQHPDGKFHFRPHWELHGPAHQGLPEFPDYHAVIDLATAERPFRMVAAPARQFLNSSFSETPTSRRMEKAPTAQIHPDDAAALGLEAGAKVMVGNDHGQIPLAWKAAEGIAKGVVVVESLWPNADFEGGLGINTLISADAGFPNGGGVFHDTAVWIKPLASTKKEA